MGVRKATAVAAACAAALGAPAAAGCGGDEPRKAAAQKPTAGLSISGREDLPYGRRATLRVILSQARGGDTNRQVRLLADAHPYDRYVPVGTRRTAGAGDTNFRVAPRRNTRYRAELVGQASTSDRFEVFVVPRLRFQNKATGLRLQLTATVVRPRKVRPLPVRIHFYFARAGQTRFRRVAAARFGADGKPRAVASIPAPRSKGFVAMCAPSSIAEGFGPPPDPTCGKTEQPAYMFE